MRKKLLIGFLVALAAVSVVAGVIRGNTTLVGALNFAIQGQTFVSNPAVLMGGGSNASPLSTDTADKNFLDFRVKSTATSGTQRGMYLKYFAADTTPSGEAARIFTEVDTVGATDVHGAHISISYGASGTCTGESAALRTTFMVPDKTLGGTNASAYTELWADGTSSDMSNGAFQRYVFGGNATGVGKLDDSTALLSIEGGTIGAGNLVAAKSSAAVSHTIRIKINGVAYYLMVSDTQ